MLLIHHLPGLSETGLSTPVNRFQKFYIQLHEDLFSGLLNSESYFGERSARQFRVDPPRGADGQS